MLNTLKNFLKKIDYFGIEFTFEYESKDKYHSITGGIVFLFFILISLIYTLITLTNLIQRKNLTVVYYKMQIPSTDSINFDNYTLTNAFSVVCSGQNSSDISDYFSIQTNKVSLTQYNGEVQREKIQLNYSYCTNAHFYNKFNESVELYGLNSRYCFDDNNITIEGLYTDEVYKYVEITLYMTKTDPEDYQKYYDLLTQNDCSFQIYYTNFAFDVNNFDNPVTPFIGNKFVKLQPNFLNKMELYFLQQKFNSYENYLFDNYHSKYYSGFSDISSFSLYKGNDRFEIKPDSYNQIAKFFLRADTARNIITRKYMKITEFAASTSSLLSGLLIILNLIFKKVNRFYALESIVKNINKFKGVSNKNFKIFKKIKNEFSTNQIEKISQFADDFSHRHSSTNNSQINKKYIPYQPQILKNFTENFEKQNKNYNSNLVINKLNLNRINSLYNNNNNINNNNINNISNNNNNANNNNNNNDNNDNNNNNNINNNTIYNSNYNNINNISNNSEINKVQNSSVNNRDNIEDFNLLFLKNQNSNKSPKKSLFLSDKEKQKKKNQFNQIENLKIKKLKTKTISNQEKFIFQFNLCEIFSSFLCPCFLSKNLGNKIQLINIGKKNLDFQLDIFTYIHNNQILEILTYILLEPYQKTMLKFISKPSISLVKKFNVLEQLNHEINVDINDEELDEFCTMFKYLQKTNYKSNEDQRLFELVNLEMNNLFN